MRIYIFIIALFLLSIKSKAQSTDSNHYDVGYHFAAPNSYSINPLFNERFIIDGVTNDTIEGLLRNIQAGSFIRACFKLKHWTNPYTGAQPFLNVTIIYRNLTVR